jgi:3-methylcrotonyl-CoA carboxylase alpha subunit
MFKILLKPVGEGETIEVQVERAPKGAGISHRARLADRDLELGMEVLRPGQGWLTLDGRIMPCYAARVGDEAHIWLGGKVYRAQGVSATPSRARGQGDQGQKGTVLAPMPGTILKVVVEPGQEFAEHETLVIMESMKMEMSLSVPHAGKVESVHCEAGELVNKDVVLIKLAVPEEPDDAP